MYRHTSDSQKDLVGLQLQKLAVTERVIRTSTGAPGALCGEGNAEILFQLGVREVVLRGGGSENMMPNMSGGA